MKGVEVNTNKYYSVVLGVLMFFCSFITINGDLIFKGERHECRLLIDIVNNENSAKSLTLHLYGTKFFDKNNQELNIKIDSFLDEGSNLIIHKEPKDKFEHKPFCMNDSNAILVDTMRIFRQIMINPQSKRQIEIFINGKIGQIRKLKYITFYSEEVGLISERRVEIVH